MAVGSVGRLTDNPSLVWLLTDDGAALEPIASFHPDPSLQAQLSRVIGGVRQGLDDGFAGKVHTSGRAMVVDELVRPKALAEVDESFWQAVDRYPIESLLLVPLRARGVGIGVLGTAHPAGAAPFGPEDIEVIQRVADRIAAAIDDVAIGTDLMVVLEQPALDVERPSSDTDLLDRISDAVITTDRERRVMRWNEAATRLYGWTETEALGRPFDELVHTTFVVPSVSGEQFQRDLERVGSWHGEVHQQGRDGKTIEVLTGVTMLRTPDGRSNGMITVNRDLTPWRAALRSQTELSRGLLDAIPDTTAILDLEGNILVVNDAWYRFAEDNGGYRPALGVGVNYLDVCTRATAAGDLSADQAGRGITAIIEGDLTEYCLDYPCAQPDGVHWFTMKAFALGAGSGVVVTHSDITWRKEAEAELEFRATHDAVSGLPNRRMLEERLTEALLRARAHRFGEVGVLFTDVDRFKLLNDSLGHVVGDQVLDIIASRMAGCLRPDDLVARFGGDELVVVVEEVTDRNDFTALVERLMKSVRQPIVIDGIELVTTVSGGVVFADGDNDVERVLRDADAAMYQAKKVGPGCFRLFNAASRARTSNQFDIERGLRAAVERDELFVEFQPVYAVDSGRMSGCEALVRWNHPVRGRLGPESFIGIAEDSGQIVSVGAWVLDRSLATAVDWPEHVRVGVNLSVRQLSDPDLLAMVDRTLERHGMAPERLVLEITESALMPDPAHAADMLSQLRQRGVALAIDDFGTGYSSLAYLQDLPVDILKIDRSFIRRLPASGVPVVDAIIRLADALGIDVIAEGVETIEQLEVLAGLGCSKVQGFLLSPPVPDDQFEPGHRWTLPGAPLRLAPPVSDPNPPAA